MITAQIGENNINCYDGKYSKEELKTWASKNIIKCPVCGQPYEYCHGLINTPYFRHKEKCVCDDMYSEPETEEHIKGKVALYEWIKEQDGVTNAVLESWLPDTKQRPDIMFEYNGKKWVIEFQCSPIATEQIERHKLYQAGGINDIWICGVTKYGTGRKHMEKVACGMYHYATQHFVLVSDAVRDEMLPFKHIKYPKIHTNIPLFNLTFVGKIAFTDKAMQGYISRDNYEEKIMIRQNELIKHKSGGR